MFKNLFMLTLNIIKLSKKKYKLLYILFKIRSRIKLFNNKEKNKDCRKHELVGYLFE